MEITTPVMLAKTAGAAKHLAYTCAVGYCLFGISHTIAQDENRDLDNYDNSDSIELALADVPNRVLSAARESKGGIYFTHAVRDLESDDEYYYTLEGSTVGRYWIVVVRADGRVIKVREEADKPSRKPD